MREDEIETLTKISILSAYIQIPELYTAFVSIKWMRKDSNENRKSFSNGQLVCLLVYIVNCVAILILISKGNSNVASLAVYYSFFCLFYIYTWRKSKQFSLL